jgi:biopolymer transport protein ExbB/TolQ
VLSDVFFSFVFVCLIGVVRWFFFFCFGLPESFSKELIIGQHLSGKQKQKKKNNGQHVSSKQKQKKKNHRTTRIRQTKRKEKKHRTTRIRISFFVFVCLIIVV